MDYKSQKIISYVILATFSSGLLIWYFFLQTNIANDLSSISDKYNHEKKIGNDLKRMQNNLETVINKFRASNEKFNNLLKRIPSIHDQDNSLTSFKDLIQAHSLKINKFEPSQGTIEEKNLSVAETGDKITIKKYAVDVVLTGDFLSFGYLLDYLATKSVLINITNVEFFNSNRNNIKFLAYVYFQEGNKNPELIPSMEQFIISDIFISPKSMKESNYIGSITTVSWKGEEVVVGIDNPQYTSDGLEIYSIEYSDGRKEFVERSKLPPELFDGTKENKDDSRAPQNKQDVIELKTQFSDQLLELEERIKSFNSVQKEQQKKYESELLSVEQEYKSELQTMQKAFEEQLERQEKKITAFEEQEKLKEELKKIDESKLEQESKAKLETLQYKFDNQLRMLKSKISSFEDLQQQQQDEYDNQKRTADRQNRSKLKALQEEFEGQLREQQAKITAFESMQAQQKREKLNQEETNKENQRQLNEMQREFEGQLREQQSKIAAFESMQLRQQQEMAEQKLLAKQVSKEKLAEIQQEFIDQLQKKENRITSTSSQLAVKPTQKLITEKQKPDLTPADKKAIEKKKMKEFMVTLKELEAQEKKKQKEKSQSQRRSIRPVAVPVRKITPRLEQNPSIAYENLDNVFENMAIEGVYQFRNEKQKLDIIIITSETETVAQIKQGYWEKPGIWKNDYRNLTNVRIAGDKLFSAEQNGEFIFYEDKGELKRGLRMDNLWSGENPNSDYGIGRRIGSIGGYYQGSYPHTSIRLLKKVELENMASRIELKLMRNEIFARYGYKFEPNGYMDQHFSDQRWYQPQYEDVTSFLTDIEIQNVNQIKGTELEFIEAVNFLKSFAN
tara:strand:+ start:2409 stop:4946 length:2538 start_codon:yes stop_codon:yes gene_type:complete